MEDPQSWITLAASQALSDCLRLVVPPEAVSSFFPRSHLQSHPRGLQSSSVLLTSLLLGGRCECGSKEKTA